MQQRLRVFMNSAKYFQFLFNLPQNLFIFPDDNFFLGRHERNRSRLRVETTIGLLSFFLLLLGSENVLLLEDVARDLTVLGDSLDLRVRAVLLLEGFVVSEGVFLSWVELEEENILATEAKDKHPATYSSKLFRGVSLPNADVHLIRSAENVFVV